MKKIEYWVAKKVNGKEILLFKKPSWRFAISMAEKYKDKGYYVKVK